MRRLLAHEWGSQDAQMSLKTPPGNVFDRKDIERLSQSIQPSMGERRSRCASEALQGLPA
jgi:hypothetical protein